MKDLRLQFYQKIEDLPISKIAKEQGFEKRKPKKIEATHFVVGFFLMLQSNGNSLRDWASKVNSLNDKLVSKQMIDKKLQFRQVDFAHELLLEAIAQSLRKEDPVHKAKLFEAFHKVYVEDSTCLKLPDNLHSIFPGPHSSKGPCATARVQLCIELLSESVENILLQSYRDIDQKHASDIVSILQPGDLVIRDRGFWSLKVFRQIIDKEAFVLSRFQYGTWCMDPKTHKNIELLKYLKAKDRHGIHTVDMPILLGKEEKLPMRLVAIKVDQSTYQARRRKALKDRCQSINHSQDYLALLQWNIFITNVEPDTWTPMDILRAYRFRWRIEIIFKCWKSKFNIMHLFENKHSLSQARVVITCLLFLLFLLLFFVRWTIEFTRLVYEHTRKLVSVISLAQFIQQNFQELITAQNCLSFVERIAYFCTYQKRKDRVDYLELLHCEKLS